MSKVNIHCDDDTPDQLHDWTTAISERIRELNRSEVCTLASFPGPSHHPVFDHLQYGKLDGGKAWERG